MGEGNDLSGRPGFAFSGALTQPTGAWNISDLVRTLAARGQQPAVIEFLDSDIQTWDSKTLAREVLRLAHGLGRFEKNSRVVLWAPNSRYWIAKVARSKKATV